jgi:arylsulfatase A-like enzyme
VGIRAWRAGLLAALLVLGAGCAPRACAPPPVRKDLLKERVAVAEKRWDGVLLEIGAPQALPFLGEGWSYGEPAPDGSLFRWAVTERSSFRFESERDGTYLAYFECEPFFYEGSPAQWVEVIANGAALAPFELRPGRERYPVQIPIVSGENRIELRFRYAGEPARSSNEKRRLAAAFYRFEVPFQTWTARTGAFASNASGVLVPSGGTLSFFLELPENALLRVRVGSEDSPELRSPAGSEVEVTIATDDRDLWKETFTVSRIGGETWERELPSPPESPVEVTFRAGSHDLLLYPELLAPVVEDPPPSTPVPGTARSIVLVLLDGASAGRLGLYGGDAETTPVLDALGRESVVFDAVVTQAVYTIASIGSLLTGQYPERHQSVSFADRLRDDVVTLPSLLSRSGYRTAAFPGNAVVSKTFGLDRGYQEFIPVWEREGYSGRGDSVVSAFEEWLSRRPEKPFFAYVHFREPHFPYNPPPPFDTRFGRGSLYPGGIADASVVDDLNRNPPSEEALSRVRGLYLGNLSYVDSLVGDVLSMLDEETIVVVTADHGEALFEHGFLGHNTQLYEESIRIPLLIRAKGFVPRRVSDLVELIDLTPTLAELAGIARAPETSRFQGRSLVPALDGRKLKAKLAFSRTLWAKPRYSVRSDRFKLIWDTRTGGTEVYDLRSDPEERTALESRVRGGYLKEELLLWYREQERLKAEEPAPDDAILSEEDRLRLETLNYLDHLPEKKPR